MVEILGSGRGWYQGIPIVSADFSRSPGIQPDRGSVIILVKNFADLKIQVRRPMFGIFRDESNALRESPVIDGRGTTLYDSGRLIIESPGVGKKLSCIAYIQQDGVEEVAQMQDKDTGDPISLVRISLVDEREWWSKRGFVFGTYNKLGADGEPIDTTGNPENFSEPWTLRELLKIGVENLPTRPTFSDVHLAEGTSIDDFQPLELEPRFWNPGEFLEHLLEQFKLIPVLTLDNKFEVYERGVGQSFEQLGLPPELIKQNFLIKTPDYTPEAILLYSELPSMSEIDIVFHGQAQMVLPDPRTGELRPWRDVTKYYFGTGSGAAHIEIMGKAACVNNTRTYGILRKAVRNYIKNQGGLQDHTLDVEVSKSRNPVSSETDRRVSILAEHMFKYYQIPEKYFSKLPFGDSLLSESGAAPVSATGAGTDEEKAVWQGKPNPVECHIISSYPITAEDGDPGSDEEGGSKENYWITPAEPHLILAGPTTFKVENTTGVVIFQNYTGGLHRKNAKTGAFESLPPYPDRRQVEGETKEHFWMLPPIYMRIRVAHEFHGSRDLRASPGKRNKIPPDVIKQNLQCIASPEDHYLLAYKDGKKSTLDEIEKLYPYTEKMEGVRKLYTLATDDKFTQARDERIDKLGNQILGPIFRNAAADQTGRRIDVIGIWPIDVDGVISQVSWKLESNGITTTSIVINSLRHLGPMGSMTYQQKQGVQAIVDSLADEGVIAKNKTRRM